jgi:hypothetical protein
VRGLRIHKVTTGSDGLKEPKLTRGILFIN